MQKIISIIIAICLLFITVAPVADASVRIRRTRNTMITPYYPAPVYQSPYYTAPIYQSPVQVTHTSVGSTYYYSPTYVAGYTYYSTPTPGYYYYSNIPTQTPYNYTTQQGQYYFSPTYIAGYTYYSSPNSGYYYYYNTTVGNAYSYNNYYTPPYNNSNLICTIINNVYQCVNNAYGPISSTYPGCTSADIVIGGQIWASCNALDRNAGSTARSGWFFAGDSQATFASYNGSNTTLEWMGKQTQTSAWTTGPCASGYRLPTRGEWEVLQSYTRANNSTIGSLIGLQLNGAYQASRNTGGDVTISSRPPVSAAYWTSTMDGGTPTVMHIGSTYGGYTTTGTDYGYVNSSYQWAYTDSGLELQRSTVGELANVRCVRQ
jgi:hypothetical protein